MGLRLLLGPAAGGKSRAAMQEIRQLSESGKKIYYIVPEQMTLATEESLMETLQKDALFSVDVLSFKRLAAQVFQEVGQGPTVLLDDVAKSMLLYRIARHHQKELTYYHRSISQPGFIRQLKTMVTEIIEYGLQEDSLQETAAQQEEGSILRDKLHDIALLWHYFQAELNPEEGRIASEMLLTAFAKAIPDSEQLKNSILYLDGFNDFTPQQFQVIRALLQTCDMVHCCLTLPREAYEAAVRHQTWRTLPRNLYFKPSKTLLKLMELSRDLRIPFATRWCESDVRSDELTHVTRYLCLNGLHPFPKPAQQVVAIRGENRQEEIALMLHEILHLVREQGLQYRDIAIVLVDPEGYIPLLRRMASLYEIPLFVDAKTDVTLNPYVQWLQAVLELLSSGFSGEAFLSLVKTGFTDLTREEADGLENLVIRENWQGKARILEGLKASENQHLISLAERLELLAAVSHDATGLTAGVQNFTTSFDIEGQLNTLADDLRDRGELLLSLQYARIYEAITKVQDQIIALLKDLPVSLEGYSRMLSIGLRELKLGQLPAALDQITVADLERSRLSQVKALFLLGVNGGSFPKVGGGDSLLTDAERTKAGSFLEMAQGEKEAMMSQYYALYLVLGKASEKIYLLSSKTGLKGEALGDSPLWARLPKVLGEGFDSYRPEPVTLPVPYLLEGENEGSGDANSDVDSNEWLKAEVLRAIAKTAAGARELLWQHQGRDAHEEEEVLSSAAALRLMDPTQRLLSVTQMERYAQCPYAYYLRYGLNLKEREMPEVRQLEDGTVLHDLLYDAGEYLSKELSQEEAEALAEKLLTQKEGKFQVYQTSGRFQYYWQKLQKSAARSLRTLSQQASLSDFHHQAFEWTFGQDYCGAEPITLRLRDGKTIRLMGKIDRVDRWDEGEDTYITIIDYKSGSTTYKDQNVAAGVQLQLPVYMEASRRAFHAKPAGYFYFHLMPNVDAGKDLNEAMEEDVATRNLLRSRLDGVYLNDPGVVTHLDKSVETGDGLLLSAKINKNGSLRKNPRAVSFTDMERIEDFINQKITTMAERMEEGVISRSPLGDGSTNPCSYCEYRHACPYDGKLPGSRQRHYPKVTGGLIGYIGEQST